MGFGAPRPQRGPGAEPLAFLTFLPPRLNRREACFQCGEAAFGGFLAGAGVGGQFGDGFEFLAAHEFQFTDGFIDAGADAGFHFLAQAGQGGDGAAGDAGQVFEEAGAITHSGALIAGHSLVITTWFNIGMKPFSVAWLAVRVGHFTRLRERRKPAS